MQAAIKKAACFIWIGGYMRVKRFLGFTDGIKEPQKTRTEKVLSKYYRYNGDIYNTITYLCMKLIEGCMPGKEENYQYYKRNGELSKPRTLYKFNSPDNTTYVGLNKTEYNFVCYLLEKGLNTEKAVISYDKADVEHTEAEQRKKEAEKAQQEAEEKRLAEEKKKIEAAITEEEKHITQEEKELADSIFISMYGAECKNYSLIALVHNFDNQYCKEEIISRLHNYNQASIKLFECLTGLELPKSYRKRVEYIRNITMKNFKGMTEYKPYKKKETKEVHKEEFYIAEGRGRAERWTKVIAEPFRKYGVDMFIFCNNGHWNISLAESGVYVATGRTKKECMANLKKYRDIHGKEDFLQKIKCKTELVISCIGANPRYKTV